MTGHSVRSGTGTLIAVMLAGDILRILRAPRAFASILRILSAAQPSVRVQKRGFQGLPGFPSAPGAFAGGAAECGADDPSAPGACAGRSAGVPPAFVFCEAPFCVGKAFCGMRAVGSDRILHPDILRQPWERKRPTIRKGERMLLRNGVAVRAASAALLMCGVPGARARKARLSSVTGDAVLSITSSRLDEIPGASQPVPWCSPAERCLMRECPAGRGQHWMWVARVLTRSDE